MSSFYSANESHNVPECLVADVDLSPAGDWFEPVAETDPKQTASRFRALSDESRRSARAARIKAQRQATLATAFVALARLAESRTDIGGTTTLDDLEIMAFED